MKQRNLNLQQYLERIDYRGPVTTTGDTLVAIHSAHVRSVPFENIDVQLGRPVTTDIGDAFQKIVIDGRGGWCYEQNGLFGWALSEIGFDVTRIAAGVMRQKVGDAARASHLCLLVKEAESERQFLVDVGFGGSMLTPVSLVENCHHQIPYALGLEQTDDGHWRFWEDSGERRFGYDFHAAPARESQLVEKCEQLQSDPNSNFVLNLVAQRRFPDYHRVLRGRVLSTVTTTGTDSIELHSAEELVAVLKEDFRLDVPEVVDLWPRIVARHQEIFG